jgi:hypothetical protein
VRTGSGSRPNRLILFLYVPAAAAASTASTTCSTTRSMSRALRAGNGRFKPRNSTTGWPLTVTTKLPLPGFSRLISTAATWWGRRARRAPSILAARVLNAPHDLHASIETNTVPPIANLAAESSAPAEGAALAARPAPVGAAFFFFVLLEAAAAPVLALTLAGGFLSSTAAFAFAAEAFGAAFFVPPSLVASAAAAAAADGASVPPDPPDPPFPLGLLRVEITMVQAAAFSAFNLASTRERRGQGPQPTTRGVGCVSVLDVVKMDLSGFRFMYSGK